MPASNIRYQDLTAQQLVNNVMTNIFDKKDKILTGFFSAIPIALTGFGGGLINWRGPWEGKWNLPNLLIVGGSLGWFIVIFAILAQYNSGKGTRIISQNKLLIFSGGVIGYFLGVLIAHYTDRNLFNLATGVALIGTFWGFALSQFNKIGGKPGILISISTAFIIWTVIALFFTESNFIFSALVGTIGILFVGFVGGIIGPVVHHVRQSDTKLRWL